MIKNYLLIGFRNLRKHFSYSLINIFGLGLGLATCLLLVTWIRHELSFDRFHDDSNRIYRSSLEMSFGGQVNQLQQSPNKLLPVIRESFPDVENGVRFYDRSGFTPYIVQYENERFQETKFSYADSTFFKVFTFKFIEGNSEKALTEPNTAVITESIAKKYFGNDPATGKVVKVNSTTDYTITGVIKDIPSNSSLSLTFSALFILSPMVRILHIGSPRIFSHSLKLEIKQT